MQAEKENQSSLEAAVRGTPGALGRLLQEHRAILASYVGRHLPTHLRVLIDPQDIVQDVHFEAFRRIATFQPQQADSFSRWLLTIARNRLVDVIREAHTLKRAEGRRVDNRAPWSLGEASTIDLLTDLKLYDRTPSQSAVSRELVVLLQQSMRRLSEEDREALRLRYLDDLPVAAVAQRLAKTEGAVHQICHRGLRALREEMGRMVAA